jgi:hypothetical protein
MRHDQPYWPSLSAYTDEEIAREYHSRALRKLGDRHVGASSKTQQLCYLGQAFNTPFGGA